MNSLGSSSKWPSYDSLPSTSSYIHSESEHTEDEADVFSEGEADSGMSRALSAGEGLALPGNYLAFSAHSGQSPLRSKSDQPKHRPDRALHPSLAPPPGAAALGPSASTPGDLIFAQKVSIHYLILLIFQSFPFFYSSCKFCLSPYFLSVQVCAGLFALYFTSCMD